MNRLSSRWDWRHRAGEGVGQPVAPSLGPALPEAPWGTAVPGQAWPWEDGSKRPPRQGGGVRPPSSGAQSSGAAARLQSARQPLQRKGHRGSEVPTLGSGVRSQEEGRQHGPWKAAFTVGPNVVFPH